MNDTERKCAEICVANSVVFQGIQSGVPELGLEPLVLFAQHTHGTTLAIPLSKFNPLSVVAKLLAHETVNNAFERVFPSKQMSIGTGV